MGQNNTEKPKDQFKIILESTLRLKNYIENEKYKGYDPYDGLKSPIFRLPVLNQKKLLRFGAQQIIKRSPINLRPFLGIPKGYNPVSLGLCLQAYSYLIKYIHNNNNIISIAYNLIPIAESDLKERIFHLIKELKNLIPQKYNNACWGYDFHWEAKYASIGALQPTVVATGIISNALYETYTITGIKECTELIESSAQFVLNDLNKIKSGNSIIYSYSPFDKQQVFNASMKAARILAQSYSLTGNELFMVEAKRAVSFVVSHQRYDGSWGYSLADKGSWTDNYHTGYVLDCLHEYINHCKDNDFDSALEKGYSFYKQKFINEEGMPHFYSDSPYPADSTAAGQTILSLSRFGDYKIAEKVALWMIRNMHDTKGFFYYRKYKHYIIKTPFMRWSNAWMFVALAYLLSKAENK